ncbi:MAG: D-alanyl-D-alanine carboxypeptidase [Clostridia bacterium]|nr:D-alanyl-D-alanine carboxypeptidase [Clostridia bacterium]
MKKIYEITILSILIFTIGFGYSSVYAEELSVNANASLIVEVNSGKVIYENNSEEQNYPASVTKILTAILTIENCKLDDLAIVTNTAVSNIPDGYVVAPLMVGEEIRVEDLLYALMLKSANDAAYVLAEHVGGSVGGFSDMMNKKAEEIGCKNSHFVNPNGIHNENHYTTAYDMFLISNYAMKNETFRKIVSTYEYTLPATNKYKNSDRVMQNTNSFVNPNSVYYRDYVNGIKTGTTNQAGNCLITESAKDGLEFITVVLGAKTSDSKFSETKKMIDYSFDNYELSKINDKDDVILSIEVEKATKETKDLEVVISDEITVMKNKAITPDQIVPIIELNDDIVAPINKGQEIGTIKYNVDGLEYSAKLLAANDVEKKTYYVEIGIASGISFTIIICFYIIVKIRRKK